MDEINRLNQLLSETNDVASRLYNLIESVPFTVTRRRILLIQVLVFVDHNVNAIFRLLLTVPQYLDGAHIILRSILDISITSDWVTSERGNKNLRRWIRDEKQTLDQNIKSILKLKAEHPELNDYGVPLKTWVTLGDTANKEFKKANLRAGATDKDKNISIFRKAKDVSFKTQLVYHTLFWYLSNKTHASATGLSGLYSLHPSRVKRRDELLNHADESDAVHTCKVALSWYVSQLRRVAKYIGSPLVKETELHYKKVMGDLESSS